MKNIAVVGAEGYVGSSLVKNSLKNLALEIYPITRSNYQDSKYKNILFDAIIYTANPANRYYANTHPLEDEKNTLHRISYFMKHYRFMSFYTISTFSVRTEPNTIYGKNRKKVEQITLEQDGKIIRLGPMYGGKPRNCVLKDMLLKNRIYISGDTKYSYANVNWCSEYILNNFENFELLTEIGARDSISLLSISDFFGLKIKFGERKDSQITQNFQEGPCAEEVIDYLIKYQNSPELIG